MRRAVRRRPAAAGAVLLTVGATFAAAVLQRYPYQDRLLLFLVPLFALAVASGVAWLIASRAAAVRVIGVAAGVILLTYPALVSAKILRAPMLEEEVKPVFAYIARHHQPGDALFLYYKSVEAYDVYHDRYDLNGMTIYKGDYARNEPEKILGNLEAMRGHSRRVWVLFSHVFESPVMGNEEIFIRKWLDGAGRQIDKVPGYGASAYLYELSLASQPTGDAPGKPAK